MNVAVKKTATISHVFDGHLRAYSNFEGRVTADLAPLQVRLEERTHLSITRTTPGQDREVECERQKVDQKRDDYEADNSGGDMACKLCNRHLGVTKLVPEILDRVKTD